ncbi:hypothetical protein AB7340_16080 [Providencia alcalifaciens]|uniref:hypothetical protein n=1 Tax=unclassified Providencia TaxID=2633465 RepID=UPI0034E6447A
MDWCCIESRTGNDGRNNEANTIGSGGQNITVVACPLAKPYREIMAIAEEYGEREIPKSMRDMPLDIKQTTRIHNDPPRAGF